MAERDTTQVREWKGDFGKDYTDRNTLDPTEPHTMFLLRRKSSKS